MSTLKEELCSELDQRVSDKILEPTNADLLKKLIANADSDNEAMMIAEMGTTYKRTGLHFDKRLEKMTDDIRYFRKNEQLSFHTDDSKPTHKLIIGDNYEVLQNLLVEYKGRVDVIYIDPPYGKDSMGEFAQTNYENAITRDNLLSMLYPRLLLAKQLLSDSGVIFCSIDDKNQAYVKCLFDDVFGESNFVANFVWKATPGSNTGTDIKIVTEYVLMYSRIKECFEPNTRPTENDYKYILKDNYECRRGKYVLNKLDRRMTGSHYSDALNYQIEMPDHTLLFPGSSEEKPLHWNWRWSKSKVEWGIKNGFIEFKKNDGKWSVYFKQYQNVNNKDELINRTLPYQNLLDDDESFNSARGTADLMKIMDLKLFAYPKPISLLSRLFELSTRHDSIILDFFAGSGTTGHAVLELNEKDGGTRQFILCQLNEKTDSTPNGIAYDVTSKRLKRIMTGECYDGTADFDWIKKNKPYGGNLDVYEIESVANFEATEGKTPFDVIDETLYGKEKFQTLREKIEWVCGNFNKAQKVVESEAEWIKRTTEE